MNEVNSKSVATKGFWGVNCTSLSQEINKFIDENDINIIDIKYIADDGLYSALMLYRDIAVLKEVISKNDSEKSFRPLIKPYEKPKKKKETMKDKFPWLFE